MEPIFEPLSPLITILRQQKQKHKQKKILKQLTQQTAADDDDDEHSSSSSSDDDADNSPLPIDALHPHSTRTSSSSSFDSAPSSSSSSSESLSLSTSSSSSSSLSSSSSSSSSSRSFSSSPPTTHDSPPPSSLFSIESALPLAASAAASGLASLSSSSLSGESGSQARAGLSAPSTASLSLEHSFPAKQKAHQLITLSHLIGQLAQASTHRKQDYSTMLQFLRLMGSCEAGFASRHGIAVWSIDTAEETPHEVGSWILVRGSERAVMKIGIGPNPGLKKYYWRDGSSKRLYKRETEGVVQDISLVYIIQKAPSASKRCVSIPGTDLWLVMYLRATPPGSQAQGVVLRPMDVLVAVASASVESLGQGSSFDADALLGGAGGRKGAGARERKRSVAEQSVEQLQRELKMPRRRRDERARSEGELFGDVGVLAASTAAASVAKKHSIKLYSQIVESFVDAYNRRDLHAVMQHFHDDIEIFINGVEKIRGFDAVQSRYRSVFTSDLHRPSATLNRTILGRRVIDHEWASSSDSSSEQAELVSIYDIRDRTIEKLWVFQYLDE